MTGSLCLSVSLSLADKVLGSVFAGGESNRMSVSTPTTYTGLLKTESAFSIHFTSCL